MGRSGQFKPGAAGRPHGAIGKLNRTVKETVLAVFNSLQSDPKACLEAWAKNETTEFYKIAAKLIPSDISATVTVVKIGKDLEEDFIDDSEVTA